MATRIGAVPDYHLAVSSEHVHRSRIRYGETDQMGVVYHANYLLYMDEGRTLLMERLGFPYHELEHGGRALVVRRAELRFRSGLRFGDEALVRTRVERVGRASVLFRYEIERCADGILAAEGTTELACVDLASPERPPIPLPADVRRALQAPTGGS